MARVEDIEKRLETRVSRAITGGWVVVGLVLGWLGGGTAVIFAMHGDIQAIKQYEKDHGGEIVENIEKPSSPESLAANLSLAAAQLQIARSERKKPDEKKLLQLQSTLSDVVKMHPNVPEAWQAAAQLLDYKYGEEARPVNNLPDCLSTPPTVQKPEVEHLWAADGSRKDYPEFSAPQTPIHVSHMFVGNCSLNLDDNGDFYKTYVGKFFLEVKKHYPQTSEFILVVHDAKISFSGGPLIPITGLEFANCAFQFTPSGSIPNMRSQALTRQLLATTNHAGSIDLPPA